MGDDRSELAQPMHRLDVVLVSGESPIRPRYAIMSPGANAAPRRWSMLTQSGVVAGSSRRLKRGISRCDDRPCARVCGRFAGEVSGIEFLDGCLDVLDVEHDSRRDAAVEVGLDDDEHISNETPCCSLKETRVRVRIRRSPRVAMTSTVMFGPEISGHPHVVDLGIPTAAGSGAGYPAPIVAVMSLRPESTASRVPVARVDVRNVSARWPGWLCSPVAVPVG